MSKIWVGLSEATIVLHWQAVSMAATLPGLPPTARARLHELAKDYDALIRRVEGSPYPLSSGRDRLAVVELFQSDLIADKRNLKDFYDTRANSPMDPANPRTSIEGARHAQEPRKANSNRQKRGAAKDE